MFKAMIAVITTPRKSCITTPKPKPRKIMLNGEEKKQCRTEENDSAMKRGRRKGVFFAFVQIREHHRILGDHPSVSSGPPISMSWEVESDEIFSVDMYESYRNHYRRSKHEFLVPASVRTKWLLDAGYTLSVLHDASEAIIGNRRKRMASITKTQLRDSADNFADNLRKTVERVMGKKEGANSSSHEDLQYPLHEGQRTTLCSSNSPDRKQLLRRHSSAFL